MKKLIYLFFPILLLTSCFSSRSYTADYVLSTNNNSDEVLKKTKAVIDSMALVNQYRKDLKVSEGDSVAYTGQPYVWLSYSWEIKNEGLVVRVNHSHFSSRKAMISSRAFTDSLEAVLKSHLEILSCNVIIEEHGGKKR